MKVTFPDKLAFLSEPHRYKVLYGGRGGIKSRSIAQHLLIAGANQSLRIPCARETMKSIKESVHQLLEDQITRLGLQRHYEVQKDEILGRLNETSFTFHTTFATYTRARERQADFMAAQTVDIADDTTKDNSFAGSVAMARSRLRIEARKWLASKLAPKKYGDKIDATLQGPDGGPIQTETTIVEYIRQKDKKDPV